MIALTLARLVLARFAPSATASTGRRRPTTVVDAAARLVPAPTAEPMPASWVPAPADEPHDGSPDLITWPMSLAEAHFANLCLDQPTGPYSQLRAVAGSPIRADAVLARVRYERATDLVASRAFGPAPA